MELIAARRMLSARRDQAWGGLGCGLRDLPGRGATADGDAPGLHGLGDFAEELDPEQAVVERRGLHLDVVSKVELPFERPSRNALVDIFVLVLRPCSLPR
jgi:hypothetical protein